MALFLFFATALLFKKPLGKLSEIYEITGLNQAYFEIETDRENLILNEEVEIKVYLVASANQSFDSAEVIVEWDEEKLEYVDSQGHLSNEDGTVAQFFSMFVVGDQGRRILLHFAAEGEPAMVNETSEPVLFASLILKAREAYPQTAVAISSDYENDLGLHFLNTGLEANAINQALADPEKLSVSFGARSPGVGGPTSEGNIALQIKFDGVPANNNDINLPDEFRNQRVWVELEDATEGNQPFAGLVDFYYIGEGIWEGKISF